MGCGDAVGRKRQTRRSEICRSFTCISPWFLFCRGKSAGRIWGEQRKTKGNVDRILGRSRYRGDVSEIGREASFNLGVGFGLIYLAAASRNELNKMAELHSEMELLLRNLRSEFRNQDKSKSNIIPSSSVSVEENLYGEEIDSDLRFRRVASTRMDQLEAELQAEFSCLQIHMDGEVHLEHSKQQQYSEMRVEESGPGQWNRDTQFYENTEQQQQGCSSSNEYYGVPPRELERKLHELLEAQQQERIDELESSLDLAMRKLEEKRKELRWWKDTAHLIARRLSPYAHQFPVRR